MIARVLSHANMLQFLHINVHQAQSHPVATSVLVAYVKQISLRTVLLSKLTIAVTQMYSDILAQKRILEIVTIVMIMMVTVEMATPALDMGFVILRTASTLMDLHT